MSVPRDLRLTWAAPVAAAVCALALASCAAVGTTLAAAWLLHVGKRARAKR